MNYSVVSRLAAGIVSFALAFSASTAAHAATKLATFVGFDTLTNGAYMATIGTGNTLNADGSVTIGSSAIDFTTTTNWASKTTGISVLVKYSNLPTSLTDGAAVASVDTSKKSMCSAMGLFANSNGVWKGIWEGKAWNSTANESSQTSIAANAGYLLFTYSDNNGTRGFSAAGTVYSVGGLKASEGNVGEAHVGGTGADSMLATGMVVEGVSIYCGEVDYDTATNDYEAAVAVQPAQCLYDWTFTNTLVTASTSKNQATISTDNGPDYLDGKALAGYNRPYYKYQFSAGQSLVYYGTAPVGTSQVMFSAGTSGSYIIVGKDNTNGKIRLATTSACKDIEVANPNTVPHLYVLDWGTNGVLTLTVDGDASVTSAAPNSLGSGLQCCGIFGGVGQSGWGRPENTDDVTCYVNAFRVYSKALTTDQVAELKAEFANAAVTRTANTTLYYANGTWCTADRISVAEPIEHDTLIIDTAFTAASGSDFINMVKGTNYTVKLSGETTINFGTQKTAILSTLDYKSGTHCLTWLGGHENMNIGNATAEPTLRVENKAVLNFTAKDITGWKGAASSKVKQNVIHVDAGGTLNFIQSSTDTFYYQGRLLLQPGALMTIAYSSNKFRLNGGCGESSEQIYVPDTTEGADAAVVSNATTTANLYLASDTTAGYAVYVGTNATLKIYNDLASAGAQSFGKYGEGVLELLGDLSTFAGTIQLNAGTLVYKGVSITTTGSCTYEQLEALVKASSFVAKVNGVGYTSLAEALGVAGSGGTVTLIEDYDHAVVDAAAVCATLVKTETENVCTVTYGSVATSASLLVSEVMPKPTDGEYDDNGLTSGWVEFLNTNETAWVNLADYRLIRVNRGKKVDFTAFSNLCTRYVGPGQRAVVYTSERYPNGDKDDEGIRAFQHGVHDGKTVEIYAALNNYMVFPDKVNPKKFPFLRLYYAPGGTQTSIVDTIIIPADTPESWSIIVGHAAENEATQRWLCPTPTKGAENTAVQGLKALGPQVGPLYEGKSAKKHDSTSEFARSAPPAQGGADYEILVSANPVMNPQGEKCAYRSADKLAAIQIVYRRDLDDATLVTNDVSLTTKTSDTTDWGDTYTATIPAAYIDATAAGHLIQWKFLLNDNAGNVWMSPAFNNTDDGYQWYGTIKEPDAAQLSAKLPTWHMFIEDQYADKSTSSINDTSSLMNTDADATGYITTAHPYGARVGIYDSSTSNYYDFVRIDLRGNTSKDFYKKSHGLRFAKTHPLAMHDIVNDEDLDGIRKTSLISEFADPSYLRQMIAFWLFNKVGSECPFDFPVRVNLNGNFYQLAFQSERFTDELIEDFYGWGKFGYGYKEAGPWGGTRSQTEKKTPDDGDESDCSVLNTFCKTYLATSASSENEALTKTAVTYLDLPRWLNYLATSKITSECDDIWANLGSYLDKPEMKEGVSTQKGVPVTGTWRPAGYDMNLSFGQFYQNDTSVDRTGLSATNDWFKSHPFYGGLTVRAYGSPTSSSPLVDGNHAVETIWQHAKFRRLYLRRLRTLMDSELGAPNADETWQTSTSPILVKMREMMDLMAADAATDRAKWGPLGYNAGGAYEINVWGDASAQPSDMTNAVVDIWENYIVPRRTHLFVTHAASSIGDESKTPYTAIGYGSALSAGIPAAQSGIAALKDGFGYRLVDGGLCITNANEETVDLSGWVLAGPVAMTLPNGTVIDRAENGVAGELYVVTNRLAFVAALGTSLADQIIVGNAAAGTSETESLVATDADKTDVFYVAPPSPQQNLRVIEIYGSTIYDGGDSGEYVVLTNLSAEAVSLAGLTLQSEKNKNGYSVSFAVTLTEGEVPGYGTVKIEQASIWPGLKISNGAIRFTLTDEAQKVVQVANLKFADAADEGGASMLANNLDNPCDDWSAGPIHDFPAPEYTVGDVTYTNLEEAISNVTGATTFVLPATCAVAVTDATTGVITIDGVEYTLPLAPLTDGSSYSVTLDGTTLTVAVLTPGSLRISEICPKDSSFLISNKYETGWVELVNDGEQATDLSGYELMRFNRGKAMKSSGNNLPAKTIAAGARVVIYCNEYFPNAKDLGGDGVTAVAYGDEIVYPNKISQKKYPMVCLYKSGTLIDKVIVPVDCPDGSSIVCETKAESAGGDNEDPEEDTGDRPGTIFPEAIDWCGHVTTSATLVAEAYVDANGVSKTENLWNLTGNVDKLKGVTFDTDIVAELTATNAYTVDLWFCVTDTSVYTSSGENYGTPIFYARGSASGAKEGVILYVTREGQLAMQPRPAAGGNSGTQVLPSDTDYNDGLWHHLIYVGTQLATGRVMVEVDGTNVWNAAAAVSAPLRADTPLSFGCATSSWAIFRGCIADVKLYAGNNILGNGYDTVDESGSGQAVTNDYTIAHGELKGGVTRRFQTTHATKGAENNLTDAVAVGPQISSLYGVDKAKDPWVAFPLATPNAAYTVTLPVNPVDSANADDAIAKVELLYRADFGDINVTEMTKGDTDSLNGQLWTAEIPASAIPAAGHLIRWAAKITDAAGNVWRAPSFNDPDGSYEWYGTIVTPEALQVSATLQTFHVFGKDGEVDYAGSGSTGFLMNKQYDSISGSYPYGARVGIYDSASGLYYDNVRIDLRGNTTAGLHKKAHGLRFNKAQPITCTDPVTGYKVDGVRKTSWTAEYADPSYLRHVLSMKAYADNGMKVPFAYPARVNMNGKFYELIIHTNRFTDELLTDQYGLDEFGYGYKSVGQFNSSLTNTAGNNKKVLPDDGDESDVSEAKAFAATYSSVVGDISPSTDFATTPTYSTEVSKTVVKTFDLPAWLNYIANVRTGQECDDVWANMCAYYDVNGNGTWMPLAYDLHLAWGAWYYGDVGGTRVGSKATDDAYKSHPFYGGRHVWTGSKGNCAVEAVFQNEKFRRLYLRRLRTVIDATLKEPGTPKANTPEWAWLENVASNMVAEAALDRSVWGYPTSCSIWPWSGTMDFNAGLDDLWDNYFVPRREHFYVTHSVTNTEKAIGYGQALNAGIPLAQSAIDTLKVGFGAAVVEEGVVMITNLNAETVDMSGWTVSGPVTMTLPAGTVIDLCTNGVAGALYVVTDRKAYVAALGDAVTDQVIVGNAAAGAGTVIGLKTADGETVIAADVVLTPGKYENKTYDLPVSLSGEGKYELHGVVFNAGLTIPEGTYTLKNQGGYTNTASKVTSAGSIVFTGKGAFEMVGTADTTEPLMTVGDLYVSNGVFYAESKATAEGVKAVVVNGDFVVESEGTVSVKLTKKTVSGIAISQEKKNKVCRIGSGGTFLATINGKDGCAIKSEKKGVVFKVDAGAFVSASATGSSARCFELTQGSFQMVGGILCAINGDSSGLMSPEADGQAYATLTDIDTETASYVTALSQSGAVKTRYYFEKPKGGAKALVSLPGLTGAAAVEASVPAEATQVASGCWSLVLPAAEIEPGAEGATLAATNAEEAAAEAAKYVIVLSDYDTEAGLTTNSLIVVAEAVTNAAGEVTGYRAVVAVNPATVNSPAIGGGTIAETSETVEPLAFEETTAAGTAVSIGVNNAVKGLWYGYEVSDAVASGYANDTGSFTRAKETTVKITGTPRKAATGFFRVKVLPAKPTK